MLIKRHMRPASQYIPCSSTRKALRKSIDVVVVVVDDGRSVDRLMTVPKPRLFIAVEHWYIDKTNTNESNVPSIIKGVSGPGHTSESQK